MSSGLDLVAILKLVPPALAQVQKYRRTKLARTLDRRVREELEADPQLGPKVTEALLGEWLNLHNDPRSAFIVGGLLRHGSLVWLEAFRIRARELLDGLETLPLPVDDTVDRLVLALRNNFVAAQKDNEDATQTATAAVLSAIEFVATKEDLSDAVVRLERSLTPRPVRVLLLAGSFGEFQQRVLTGLIDADPEGAGQLGQTLSARGVAGVVSAVVTKPEWTIDRPAAFWRACGRLCSEAGQPDAAEAAFVNEFNSPDVADPVRALVNAARSAEASDEPDGRSRADVHSKLAATIDASHPLLELFRASRADTAQRRLDLTDAVVTVNDAQEAQKLDQRAMALLGLRRWDEAQDAAVASRALRPHGAGQELATVAIILKAHSLLPSRDRDDRPLMDAVAYQLSLFHEAREAGRTRMAGVVAARAALGAAVLGDRAAGRQLFDTVLEEDGLLSHEETKDTLFEAALTLGDASRASQVAPADDSAPAQLRRATVSLMKREEVEQAIAVLDQLLVDLEPGPLRQQAIVMRMLAPAGVGSSFDEAIADEVDDGLRLRAQSRAARFLEQEEFDRARAAMSPFDDVRSLSIRQEIAERSGSLNEAIALQTAVVRLEPSAMEILHLAVLKGRLGDYEGAIRTALRLATDERKVPHARDRAFELAAQAAIDAGDFEELEDISERWAELTPDRTDPRWAKVFALARQDRHAEGLALARDAGLEPVLEARRHLLWAELLRFGETNGPARMKGLMDLSERFGRPLELERAFIGGVLATEESDREGNDPAVVERFQEALNSFESRFPDSAVFRKIEIADEADGEDLVAQLAEVQGPESEDRISAIDDAVEGLRRGTVPVAFVAGLVGRGTVETAVRNDALPLAVFDRASFESELSAADRALETTTASWDETAVITLALLAEAERSRLQALGPGSCMGQLVRDAIADEFRSQMGGRQVAVMQVLPDGTPRIYEEDPATIDRIRAAQRVANNIAGVVRVRPDRVGNEDDRLGQITANGPVGPLTAVASALLTAREERSPVFSDDRVVRAYARGMGLEGFGTIALVSAANKRGLLSALEAQKLLESILDLGVWGAALSPDSYVEVARRAGFDPRRCARALLADEALLQVEPRLVHNALLLSVIADEAEDKLDEWAGLIVDSYDQLLNLDKALTAGHLAALLFDPDSSGFDDESRARTTLVIQRLRRVAGLQPELGRDDPAVIAVKRWLETEAEGTAREQLLERLLEQVEADLAADLRVVMSGDD